jgi:hypothetical protein
MKKIIGSMLILFSVNAFAEDIYDRINSCDNQIEFKSCVINLLRELANENRKLKDEANGKSSSDADYSKEPAKENLCVLGSTFRSKDILHRSSPHLTLGGFGYAASKEYLQAINEQWKKLSCDEESKLSCDISADHVYINSGGRSIYLYPVKSEAGSSQKEIIRILKESVCL